MATYKEIQNYVKTKYRVSIKPCWIADMKEKHKIITRVAPNRISLHKRVYPCPIQHEKKIEEALKYYNMIST